MSTAGSPEINVTPLIDVMLVLLVIFILVMPIMLPQEPLALPPRSDESAAEPPIALRLDADLSLSINDGPRFPNRELASRLRDLLPRTNAVFVDSFSGVPWGMVVATIDTVRGVADNVHRGGVTVALRLRDE